MESSYRIVHISGGDQPGIFVSFCRFFYENQINILDVVQSVLRGHLSITFLVDINQATINEDRMKLILGRIGRDFGVSTEIVDYREGYRPKVRNLYVLTIIGKDHIGLLFNISNILAQNQVNIETIQVKENHGFLYNQFILDCSNVPDMSGVRGSIRKYCEDTELSFTLQPEVTYRKNKRLIVFDMDSTLVANETIVDIAKIVGKEQEMDWATQKVMETAIDFKQSLKERAKLLQGVSEEALQELAEKMELTQGAEELISELKQMGWKIGVVSSGFSYFTDAIKRKLGLDYSFGNTLEIKEGKATGRVVGDIIDGEGKWEIVKELALQMGISPEEIVTVGDGSNDVPMVKFAGLGIAFNSKEILSEVADGKLNRQDFQNILLMMGFSETEIDQIIYGKSNEIPQK